MHLMIDDQIEENCNQLKVFININKGTVSLSVCLLVTFFPRWRQVKFALGEIPVPPPTQPVQYGLTPNQTHIYMQRKQVYVQTDKETRCNL